ncbi:MAG: hypothetical protein ACF8PG_14825 [Maioricimonas sp. JB045]
MSSTLDGSGSRLVCEHRGEQIEVTWHGTRFVADASGPEVLLAAVTLSAQTLAVRSSRRRVSRFLQHLGMPCTVQLQGRPLLHLGEASGLRLLQWLGLSGIRPARPRLQDIPLLFRLLFSRRL